MTTCPKCGFDGPDELQCVRCGIIFERMHTVLDHSPVGALAEAARRANEVARTLGVAPAESSQAPTIEVPRVAPREPPAPAPATPPVVHLVPRAEEKRRTWLLVGLLGAVILLFVDQLQERRQMRQQIAEAASQSQRPVVDETYLELALESMLDEARTQLRRIDDPAAASATLDELLRRVSDLEKRLETARAEPSWRSGYAHALERLRDFLQEDARAAIVAATAPDARPEPVSIHSLEQAEAAFESARSAL